MSDLDQILELRFQNNGGHDAPMVTMDRCVLSKTQKCEILLFNKTNHISIQEQNQGFNNYE